MQVCTTCDLFLLQVGGSLYVVDEKTLLLKDFTYDGQVSLVTLAIHTSFSNQLYFFHQGKDTFFFGGGDASPNPSGFIVPNEYYRTNVLHR